VPRFIAGASAILLGLCSLRWARQRRGHASAYPLDIFQNGSFYIAPPIRNEINQHRLNEFQCRVNDTYISNIRKVR
jgi:hypothetical protein